MKKGRLGAQRILVTGVLERIPEVVGRPRKLCRRDPCSIRRHLPFRRFSPTRLWKVGESHSKASRDKESGNAQIVTSIGWSWGQCWRPFSSCSSGSGAVCLSAGGQHDGDGLPQEPRRDQVQVSVEVNEKDPPDSKQSLDYDRPKPYHGSTQRVSGFSIASRIKQFRRNGPWAQRRSVGWSVSRPGTSRR